MQWWSGDTTSKKRRCGAKAASGVGKRPPSPPLFLKPAGLAWAWKRASASAPACFALAARSARQPSRIRENPSEAESPKTQRPPARNEAIAEESATCPFGRVSNPLWTCTRCTFSHPSLKAAPAAPQATSPRDCERGAGSARRTGASRRRALHSNLPSMAAKAMGQTWCSSGWMVGGDSRRGEVWSHPHSR